MKAIDIVKAYLEANGFGGLVQHDAECGCETDDLAPCGGDFSQCKAGYKHADPRAGNIFGWAIWQQKEPPTAEQWEDVEY